MLCIGSAAAIAGDKQFMTGVKRIDDRSRNFTRDIEQHFVTRRALQCRERYVEMSCDRVF